MKALKAGKIGSRVSKWDFNVNLPPHRSRIMEKMKQTTADCNPAPMDETLNDLKSYVERAAEQGFAAHEVETDIWRRVLQLGHQALALLRSEERRVGKEGSAGLTQSVDRAGEGDG